MALTPEQITAVTLVAEQTRADFEHGRVLDDEVQELALRYKVGHWVTNRSGVYIPIGDEFPEGCCGHSAPVLKQRIDEAGILEREAELVEGGYWQDHNSLDDEWHTFVRLERSRFARWGREGEPDTIADITSDQFSTRNPKVYIGPLHLPWTDTPRIDLWEA